ncbi:putative bifunctional diguanylate cyclase/phosphodiesterase [Mycolicibacterium hodleri]|uniref:Bifunctional diguanylate cyclase/phosphodiesterase n=1 Tax=Mycolicibacterium hodleri TaxID=49897 RepID=A0A502DSJ8_9MYCO|nr:bifunctional diguanylate cyclase/phosphodiesterase [Mycolicibacterium hodleri]TPG28307.1 bifunctional diguanylate cyclase/phosphodiesterase [Mycolicibacterium hodleri]
MAKQSLHWVIAMSSATLVAFAVWLLAGWGGAEVTSVVSLVGSILSVVFAMGCAVRALRHSDGRQRLAWSCLLVGLAGWLVGDLATLYFHLIAGTSAYAATIFGSAYLLLPIGVCTAAVFIPYGGLRSGLRVLLDGIITATSLFVVSWNIVLHNLFDVANPFLASIALAVFAVFADVAMITIAVMLLARARAGLRLSSLLMTAGLVSIAASDTVFLYYSSRGLGPSTFVILGWVVGMYFIGLCGLLSRRKGAARTSATLAPTWMSLWLPYAPVPFAIFIGAREALTGHSPPVLIAGLVLIFAALSRQFLLLADNRRLLVAVEDFALRDQLTGLANRTLFTDRLTHAMALRARNGAAVCVLLADLDDFKLVNDTLGHPVGDDLLCSVGARIHAATRPWDTVARVGGDEFAILVEDGPAIAQQIAERVVRAFEEPFVVAGRTIHMRLSIGVARAASDADVSAEELFKRADLAMYSAKRAHVGTRSFTPDMRLDATELNLPSQQKRTGRQIGVGRIQFLEDLRRAIDEHELGLVHQPKFSLSTGLAVGVEALIRWPHPQFGLLEPADFLPLVREKGLMEAVTDLVLRRAVEDAAGWQAAGVDLPVAINLSAPSLNDEELPARVLSVLAEHGMSPASLAVEITEDVLLASVVRARTVLDRLRESGIRVAIDDFGSGYAAMTYLHELPVDEIKLDRQFIAPILHDERAAVIVRSVIELADSFGLTSVAEGVEDEATADLLRSIGCNLAQGHYFSPPVPAETISLGIGLTAPVGGPARQSAATRPSWA